MQNEEQEMPYSINRNNKNKYGEVFTPTELINEMLNCLPKRVWSNPHYKWLDPCAGIGNFAILIYQRLMDGLAFYQENKSRRSQHIIKNMLFMVELNPKNAEKIRTVFGKNANIFCGDYLTEQWSAQFNQDSYDVILANPPWNDRKSDQRTGTNSGSRSLWDKFVLHSLNGLKPNGYMGFIHPANWRGLGKYHHIWDILSKKQLIYLHIYGKKRGFEIFDINSRFDLYLLQNKKNAKASIVIDEQGKQNSVDVTSIPFLSNYAFDRFKKIFTKEDNGIRVIHDNFYSTHKTNKIMYPTKTAIYKYPVIHTITKKGVTFHYSSDKSRGHFGVPKVILSFNEKQYAHAVQNDYKGELGMSQICFGIPIKSKEEGEKILEAVNSPQFQTLLDSTKWSLYQTDYRMFKYLKPDFYKFFDDN